ncbi:monocarboxylate transporter 14-like [Ylistrum balloti]|uniref:monocarboxylate transporter 14-like n=1 Tax=Ylistrum balloti TaxID=509963 RepID=UPI002905C49C|nr:monocarboxylate transporter 14-like [Ylistrum balloti]
MQQRQNGNISSGNRLPVSNNELELPSQDNDIQRQTSTSRREVTSINVIEDRVVEDLNSNKINREQNFGGLSQNVNDANVFPVGIYRKISEATSISESFYQSKESQEGSETASYRKWVVLSAGFLELFICTGFPFNMSVLNLAFLEQFGRSKAETSFVQSVATGMFFISGLPMGTAVSQFGARKVGIFGGFLSFIGTGLAFFSTNLLFLIMTLGFTTGVGLSACYISASTSVGEYFDGKSKLIALSFISFGSGFGSMLFPYLLDFLTREFGWRGCLLIVSGVMLNMVPCFAVCKPRMVGVCSSQVTNVSGMQSFMRNLFPCLQKKIDNKSRLSVVSTISTTSTLYSSREDKFSVKLKSLAKNKVYVLFTMAMVVAIPSVNCVMIFLVSALQSKGFDLSTAVFLYFTMNLTSTVFRLVPGFCKRIPHMSVLMIPVFYMGIGAVACGLLPGAITYEQHVVLLGSLGVMLGGTVTVMSVTTMKLVGMRNYSTGLGVLITAVGISNTCAGPIAGYMRDVTGSYMVSYYGVSAGLVVAMCLSLAATTMRKCGRNNSDNLEKYLESRRGTKRRSSILPWKGKVEFIF